MDSSHSQYEIPEVEREIIGFVVNVASMFHIPKSLGEIFGLLYVSLEPLPMDQIVERLGVSLGTASQGIRALKSVGAIHSVYVPGVRKEHFAAEKDFRKLLTRVIKDDWTPKLESTTSRLEMIEQLAQEKEVDPLLRDKVKTLKRLNKKAHMLFDPISKIINH